MPYRYSSEFRRKVLDLLAAGRSMASVASDLGVSTQTIYNWRKQELVDTGQAPGLSTAEQAELVAARRRITKLETELAVTRRANELLKAQVVSQKAVRGDLGDRRRGPWRPRPPVGCWGYPSPGSTSGGSGHRRPGRSATSG